MYTYILAPFFAWLTCGIIKYVINSFREKRLAFKSIGYGGFPSNHTTIITTTSMLIGFREGFNTPIFSLATAVTFIIILDAVNLRKTVGEHASVLNKLIDNKQHQRLRERMGHTKIEIAGGIFLGILLACILNTFQ